MFDWKKYDKENAKKNNLTLLLFFVLWVIFTAGIGVALAHVEGTLFIVIGAVAYLMSAYAWRQMGFWWQLKETYKTACKLWKECIDEFVKEKGLEKEFEEFCGDVPGDPKNEK